MSGYEEKSTTKVELWDKGLDRLERVQLGPSDQVGGQGNSPSQTGMDRNGSNKDEGDLLSSCRGQGKMFGRMVGL